MNSNGTRRVDWAAAVLWHSPRLRARLLRLWLWFRRNARTAATVGAAGVILSLNGPAMTAAGSRPREATITVIDGEVAVVENGRCSLIEAIHNANDKATGAIYADCAPGDPAGADIIVLPSAGEFVLTAADNHTYGPTGLPVISSEIVFDGSYITTIRRDPAADPFRILAVGREGDLTLKWTRVSGGQAVAPPERRPQVDYATSGGGILNLGQLSLDKATISGNTAVVGGGVYNGGHLVGNNLHFIDNAANYGGAALMSFGEVQIHDIDVRQSGGQNYDGVVVNEGEMELVGGYIRDNDYHTSLLNRAYLTIHGLRIEDSWLGIINEGEMTVEAATISGQETAISNRGTGAVAQTALVDNGRGIVNDIGYLSLINSTVSGNHTDGNGGGILVMGGEVYGAFNTITDNSAVRGGGAFVYGNPGSDIIYYCRVGMLTLKNSILSGNEAVHGREAYVEQYSHRCLGRLYLDGSMVGHDGEDGTVHSVLVHAVVVDAPLADLISPEWVESAAANPHHPLPWGSPAVDALPNEACALPLLYASDQLYNDRNVDGDNQPSERECDVGAVERQPLAYRTFAPFVAGKGAQR